MKIIKPLFTLLVVSALTSCATSKNSDLGSKNGKTYAELSVKTDGTWKDRKYIGGTTFNNVKTLTLDPRHTDHSFDIRYEGPGWESNKIGYRLYLDWRNAIDIFGKKTEEIILPKVGQDNFDSYHEITDWGGDILHNGKSAGIGGIARMVNGKLWRFYEVGKTVATVENYKDKSQVVVNYTDWKTNNQSTDFKSILSIFPDERYTKHTIQSSVALEGICTTIVKDPKFTELLQGKSSNGKWAYIASYGKQSLEETPDNLGLAILYETSTVDKLQEGDVDHFVIFKPTTKPVTFYLLGAWAKEAGGIKNHAEFIKYLNDKLAILNSTNELK